MAQTSRAYGFVDWSGDSGLKFAAASSQYGSLGVAVILDISGHAPCDFAAK